MQLHRQAFLRPWCFWSLDSGFWEVCDFDAINYLVIKDVYSNSLLHKTTMA